jgi:hypothetical protein
MQKELIELLKGRRTRIVNELTNIDAVIMALQEKCKHENVERDTLHTSTLVICKTCGKTERE